MRAIICYSAYVIEQHTQQPIRVNEPELGRLYSLDDAEKHPGRILCCNDTSARTGLRPICELLALSLVATKIIAIEQPEHQDHLANAPRLPILVILQKTNGE